LAITLLTPAIPMLFMGEEWGSKTPFPFFCDFDGDLAKAVREGRRREYAWAYEGYGEEVPDPLAEATFRSAKLDWESCRGSKRLVLVRKLLAVRRREIIPRLAGARFGEAQADDQGLLRANWRLGDGASLILTANLSDQAIADPSADQVADRPIWGEPNGAIQPWSVRFFLEAL